MIRPDDEGKPFVARWNSFIRVLLVEPSVKGVARAAMDHADFDYGTGVYAGNERLARVTGYSERAVRMAWAAMRSLGMAERVGYGSRNGGKADKYDLLIPSNWGNLPILGPHEGRFQCAHCNRAFNPSTSALVLHDDGGCGWRVKEMVFCPPPKRRKDGPVPESCCSAWEREQKRDGNRSWEQLGGDVWKVFRQARNDEW
ncbi:MAG: hypothetical protein JWO67_4048 [Streptosporangiaceae bacterium]|nr:hypothetical protein [Streptosporangiaceae bacterium]